MLTPEDRASDEPKPARGTQAERRLYIAELLRPHVAGAVATLEELAANARSPKVRRAAARDRKRSTVRAAKLESKP
jgi:hypothetical protein